MAKRHRRKAQRKTELAATSGSRRPAGSVLYSNTAIETLFDAMLQVPDPDRQLRKIGMSRHRLQIMEYDDEISAALETRREVVITTPWRLDTDENSERIDFIVSELTQHMETLLNGAWSALPYGYAVQEVVYRRGDGMVEIETIDRKPIEWFSPMPGGQLIYNNQRLGEREEVDTNFKFILTRRNPTHINPYGEALLSRLYWPWLFRHNGWEYWQKFMERFADPLLLGKGVDPRKIVDEIAKLGYRNVLAVGTSDDVEAITPAIAGEFERADRILQGRIQRVILGQNLTSEVQSGSLAAAKVHNEVRNDKRLSDLRMVRPAAQWLVNALWHLNRFDGEPPALVFEDEAGLDKERAERDALLVEKGVVGRFTEQYLLRNYDFKQGDFELPEKGQAIAGKLSAAPMRLAANAGDQFTADQMAVERGVDEVMAAAGSPIAPELVRSAIMGARSADDLTDRLAALLDRQDPAFADLLARSQFAAQVLGYVQEAG